MPRIEIVHKDAVTAVEVYETATIFTIKKVMQEAFGKLENEIKAQGWKLDDKSLVYTRYPNANLNKLASMCWWEKFFSMFSTMELYAGIATHDAKLDNTAFLTTQMQAGEYAQYLHTGPYNKLFKSYEKMAKALQEKGIKVVPETYEIYLNNPHTTPKEELQTLIVAKLVN